MNGGGSGEGRGRGVGEGGGGLRSMLEKKCWFNRRQRTSSRIRFNNGTVDKISQCDANKV